MSKVVDILFGLMCLLLVASVFFSFSFVANSVTLSYIVIALGILLLFFGGPNNAQRAFDMGGRSQQLTAASGFRNITRLVFGLYAILAGLVTLIGSLESALPFISLNSTVGLAILAIIGAIELFTAFK